MHNKYKKYKKRPHLNPEDLKLNNGLKMAKLVCSCVVKVYLDFQYFAQNVKKEGNIFRIRDPSSLPYSLILNTPLSVVKAKI